MDSATPAGLHSLCLWLMRRAPPAQAARVSSLQGALQPLVLLGVLAEVLPPLGGGEPGLADVRGDDEALLTVYVNACRRAGLRFAFDPGAHPALRGPAVGDAEDEGGGGGGSGDRKSVV